MPDQPDPPRPPEDIPSPQRSSISPKLPEAHYRLLERLYLEAPINRYYRPSITVGHERAEVAVPVREDMFHAADAIHGSVYFKVLDDAAFFAANSVVPEVFVLTAGFHLDLLRPVGEGEIRAVGRLVHRSRRLLHADSEAFDGRGRLVGRGSGTFMPSSLELADPRGSAGEGSGQG